MENGLLERELCARLDAINFMNIMEIILGIFSHSHVHEIKGIRFLYLPLIFVYSLI